MECPNHPRLAPLHLKGPGTFLAEKSKFLGPRQPTFGAGRGQSTYLGGVGAQLTAGPPLEMLLLGGCNWILFMGKQRGYYWQKTLLDDL